jgi:hypothetical protein
VRAETVDDFRIDVRKQNESTLKITWVHNTLSFLSYNVNFGTVRRISERIRQRLANLVVICMSEGVAGVGLTLKQIASEGRDLHDTLFLDSGQSEQNPKEVRAYLDKHPEAKFTVSVDQTIYVPWSLIYDGNPETLNPNPEDISSQAYRDFWCMKHDISTIYRRITPDRIQKQIPTSLFRMLPVFNRQAFDKARKELIVAEEKALLTWLTERFAPVYSSEEFKAIWRSNADQISLLYFHCHADGTKLALGTDDLIESHQLALEFARAAMRKREWSCLLFLNGCSTATGDPNGAFLEATGETGMCGFIGTEAEVPDVFALRFSLDFLASFLRGERPVHAIMSDLRQRHFPLSLLYSTYTYPLLQIAPDLQEFISIRLPIANFSFGKLGSQKI